MKHASTQCDGKQQGTPRREAGIKDYGSGASGIQRHSTTTYSMPSSALPPVLPQNSQQASHEHAAINADERSSNRRLAVVCFPGHLLHCRRSIVVKDRANAAVLRIQRIAAEPEQVQVERLVGLPLAVTLDLDRDCLRRLAGGEGQRAGPFAVPFAGPPRSFARASASRIPAASIRQTSTPFFFSPI